MLLLKSELIIKTEATHGRCAQKHMYFVSHEANSCKTYSRRFYYSNKRLSSTSCSTQDAHFVITAFNGCPDAKTLRCLEQRDSGFIFHINDFKLVAATKGSENVIVAGYGAGAVDDNTYLCSYKFVMCNGHQQLHSMT